MTVRLGAGEFIYEVVEGWGKLPDGWRTNDVGGVAVDQRDQVYVFNRGEHPMVVFDRNGTFVKSWGEGVFARPHGVEVSPDGTVYCTDDGDHTVRRCSPDGDVLMQIGSPGTSAGYMSGSPFCRCTHTAVSPEGDLYVSDGYGNARIHKYSPDGKLLFSWGRPGCDPGEFNLPHNIGCDTEGWVYVADRENLRVQVFDRNGRFETQWFGLHRPSALYVTPDDRATCYVGEAGPAYDFNRDAPNLGPRLSIWTKRGQLLARLALSPSGGTGPGNFLSPHGIAVDSRGDIYVGEVALTAWGVRFPSLPAPADLRAIQKLRRVDHHEPTGGVVVPAPG
jgi:DNA-binding beta-propeller fold protein YncE